MQISNLFTNFKRPTIGVTKSWETGMHYAWRFEMHTNRGPENLEGWYHCSDLGLNDNVLFRWIL
jgi:hypothetical protein